MIQFGIIEDVNDPKQLGRARVRVFGIHTHEKTMIETSDLPWASVVQPTTSAANSGVGQNPRLLNGTLVTIVFLDESYQVPLITGTLPSEIREYVLEINGMTVPRNPTQHGFQDPTGTYPKLPTGFNDIPMSAKESNYKYHASYGLRETSRYTDEYDTQEKVYQTATAASIPTVAQDGDESLYTDVNWNEPPPANGDTPKYPYNQVRVSETGITEEWDDSPSSGPRVHNFHPSGTYEEVIYDGSRAMKIVGKNTEIYLEGSNVYIKGDVNMTVQGNKRELVTGDYILEVEGDVHYNFRKSQNTKIGERRATEIGMTNFENIGGDETRMISGNQTETTVGNEYHIVNGTQATSVQGNATFQYAAKYSEHIKSNKGSTVMGNEVRVVAGNDEIGIKGNRTTDIKGADDLNVTGAITQDGSTINLNSGGSNDNATRKGDAISESDPAHSGVSGTVAAGSSTVFIGG